MSQEVNRIAIRHEFHKCVNLEELSQRFAALLNQYDALASTHITWFTHKNPYGCWICDLLSDCRTFGNYMEGFLHEQSSPDELDQYGDRHPNIDQVL